MRALILGGASWNEMVQLPELPGSRPRTMVATSCHEAVGSSGAGKALNLARLGWDTTLWALVGKDEHGRKLRQGLAEGGVYLEAIEDPRGTMHHVNLMDPRGDRISIFANPGTLDLPVDHGALVEPALACDLVAVTIFEHCRGFLAPLAAAGVDLWIDIHDYDGVNAYHDDFIRHATFLQLSSPLLPGWREFAERRVDLGCRAVVCTHGARGASVLTPDGWSDVPPVPVEAVLDSNGAGDAFFAGFATGWVLGMPVEECGQRGARTAADAVTSLTLASPVPPSLGDL